MFQTNNKHREKKIEMTSHEEIVRNIYFHFIRLEFVLINYIFSIMYVLYIASHHPHHSYSCRQKPNSTEA